MANAYCKLAKCRDTSNTKYGDKLKIQNTLIVRPKTGQTSQPHFISETNLSRVR